MFSSFPVGTWRTMDITPGPEPSFLFMAQKENVKSLMRTSLKCEDGAGFCVYLVNQEIKEFACLC